MNKLITSSTDEKTDEIDEILQDAENIILASNGDTKKHIRNKGLIIFAIVIAILVILLLAFSTVFALININSNKIMNGVFIQGIDVSGLTTDEAKEKVSNIVNKHLACKIVVKRDDFEGVFMPEQLGVTFDADSVINQAYTVGRNGNIFENNYSILNCLLNNYNISTNINFDDEFLSAPRLDNLTSCQSCLNAIMDTEALSDICNLVVLFDNEECGSNSKQGAGSVILSSILEKIYLNTQDTDKSRTAFIDVMLHSLTASLDVAHAMHPNHPEKNDPTNPIPMEGGVVIKMNYNQRYATDTNAVSIVEGICRAEKIAHTKFVNHGDVVGGGTLGSILSTSIPAMTVDLGVPILAMHSSRELMARSSQLAMDQFAEAFFK